MTKMKRNLKNKSKRICKGTGKRNKMLKDARPTKVIRVSLCRYSKNWFILVIF